MPTQTFASAFKQKATKSHDFLESAFKRYIAICYSKDTGDGHKNKIHKIQTVAYSKGSNLISSFHLFASENKVQLSAGDVHANLYPFANSPLFGSATLVDN